MSIKRQVKFAFVFAGLGGATLLVLWAAARLALLFWPGAEESVVLAAQPAAAEIAAADYADYRGLNEAESAQPAGETAVPTPLSASIPISQSPNLPIPQPPNSPIPQSPNPPTSQSPNPSLPPQLIIPSLGVSRIIRTVPVVEGQWDISEVASDFGWLQTTGEYPGDELGMTIVGHVTRPWPEIAGPLAELAFMKPGDEVIYRADGTDYVYALEKFLKVDPQSVESLYVPDGDVLSLATCSTWNYVNFDYDERLIARFRLTRAEPSPTMADQLE